VQGTTGASTLIIVAHLLTTSGFDVQPPLQVVTTYGANTAASGGTALDPGGTINTLGAYAQVTASTTYPMRGLVMAIGNQLNAAPAAARWLINIAVGVGGSEVVVIANIQARSGSSASQGGASPIFVWFPCNIPAGTRLAVNAQCTINDATDRLLAVVIYGLS
jgi:hypothetical protein